MRFVHECALRWSDLDAYGHVNNARFLTLLEEARVALFFLGARKAGLTSFEDGIVIVRHEIDYLRPVTYGTGPDGTPRPPEVRVELWVEEVRPSRVTVAYELFDADTLACRARSVCAPVNPTTMAPRRLTDAERAFLADWTA
ncbi:MAG: acyl-CoA thioesterase [Micromonosporaceae bacterium]|nr:acyl-CoA thioesterase [Micromonosporaceae bacterium]